MNLSIVIGSSMNDWRTALSWHEEGTSQIQYDRPVWVVTVYQLYLGAGMKWGLFKVYTEEDAEKLKESIEGVTLYNSGPVTIEKEHGYVHSKSEMERLQSTLGDRLEIVEQYYETN